MNEQSNMRPAMSLSMHDILTIDSALQGYLSYLKGGVAPSSQRDIQIRNLEDVRARLTALPAQGTHLVAFCIPLTMQDIQTLREALCGFVRLVSIFVPQSTERDETLQAFEGLVAQLGQMVPRRGAGCDYAY